MYTRILALSYYYFVLNVLESVNMFLKVLRDRIKYIDIALGIQIVVIVVEKSYYAFFFISWGSVSDNSILWKTIKLTVDFNKVFTIFVHTSELFAESV